MKLILTINTNKYSDGLCLWQVWWF